MDVILIDTNSIKNDKPNSFFGNIENYQKLSGLVQVIIPSIVIEEIKRQKKRYLLAQLGKFKMNYFTYYLKLDTGDVLYNHIDKKIDELYHGANDEILHHELDLEIEGSLEKIKELAINNIPPFEAETDKGFKDSYIYLTVLQYAATTIDDVFLITKDSRLNQAFNKHKNITVLTSPEEYYNYRKEYFKEDYFLGKIREFIGNDSISQDNIVYIGLTEDGDWQLSIEVNDEKHKLLVDFVSKEIIPQ